MHFRLPAFCRRRACCAKRHSTSRPGPPNRPARSIDLELRAAPDDLDAVDLVGGFADAFLLDSARDAAAFLDQLDLELAAIVNGQVHVPRVLAAAAGLL